jgi:hypothetical protein
MAERKPDMDAGVYAYARAGFGDYGGFLSALGYWLGSCIGNVSYWVLIKSTLGAFFPVFGDGNTIPAVLAASLGIWFSFHDPERRPASCRHQQAGYDREDSSYLSIHRHPRRRFQSRSFPRKLLGRRRNACG